MRYLGAICLFLAFASHSAFAQDAFKKPRPSVFFYVAPGGLAVNQDGNSSLEIGGGGNVFIYRGLGFEGDVGALRFGSRGAQGQQIHRWTGMFTLDAIYAFQRSAEQKVCPFLIAGVTAMPVFDVGGGDNFGGGIHYWFGRNYGLRMEFRDHVRSGMRTYNDIQARIALAFRR
jgi:hypothetical protein